MRITRCNTEFSAFAHTEAESAILVQSHRIFGNPVIMDGIASYATTRSLNSLTQVSSSTFYSAIRYLWAVLPSAFYVLRLLPSLIFKDNLWRLANAKLPSWELTRFDVYAPNICEFISLLSSTITGEKDIDPEIFPMVYYARSAKVAIFPRLRTLELPGGRSMVKYLATTSLTEIQLDSHAYLDDYIEDLLPFRRNIKILTLHGSFPQHVLRDLLQFRNLQVLRLNIHPFTQRRHAPLYDFLNELHQFCDLRYFMCSATISCDLTKKWHCNVKHIELKGRASSHMHIVVAGTFTQVVLCFDEREAIESYHDCFEALARSSWASLESLIIVSDTHERHDFCALQCLQPLFMASGLRTLCVIQKQQNLNIIVNNACLAAMAASWPQLTQLQLLTSYVSASGHDPQQQPTIKGLRHLVTLPHLLSLSIMSNNEEITLEFPIVLDANLSHVSQPLLKYLRWKRTDVE